MNFYRNAEGYYDPTAGAALTAIEKERKQQRLQKRADLNSPTELCCATKRQGLSIKNKTCGKEKAP